MMMASTLPPMLLASLLALLTLGAHTSHGQALPADIYGNNIAVPLADAPAPEPTFATGFNAGSASQPFNAPSTNADTAMSGAAASPSPPSMLSSTTPTIPTYSVQLDMPPRLQWPNNNGYCGETSLQMAGLYYGAWISQYAARAAGGGTQTGGQLLLPYDPASRNVGTAGKNILYALAALKLGMPPLLSSSDGLESSRRGSSSSIIGSDVTI